MKKIIVVSLIGLLLAGCGASTSVKTGLGHTVDIAKSTNATAEKNGVAQVNTVMAAASFDSKGKILAVQIDNAQVKVEVDANGKIASDKSVKPQTKVELGEKYGMIKASKIKKEWYQQIDELGKWMVGKTIEEVKAMKTKKVDDAHTHVPDVAELNSKVTISIEDYVFAVEEAYKNAK